MPESIAAKPSPTSAARQESPPEDSVRTRPTKTTLLTEVEFSGAARLFVFSALVSTVLVLAYADDYIELADQSLYLLMIDDPRAAIRSASGFHVVLSPLWSLSGESVISFRVLRAVLDIGVDVLLGLSLVRYLRWRNNDGVFGSKAAACAVVSSVVLSGFAVWIYAVNGFGYDQIGGVIFTLMVTALLWIVGGESQPSRDAIAGAFAGALFSLAFVVRWTAALASIFFLVWVLVEHCGWRRSRSLIGAAAVGAIGSLVLIHVAILDIGVVFGGLRSGTSDIGRGAYSPSSLLSRYILWLQYGLYGGAGLVAATAAGLLFFKKAKRTLGVVALTLVASALVVLLIQDVYAQSQLVEANAWGTYLGFTTGIAVLLFLKSHWGRGGLQRLNGLAIPVTFLALPVLLAAGSFLPLLATALPLATLWVASLWVTLPNLPVSRVRSVLLVGAGVMLSVLPWLLFQNLDDPARTADTETRVAVTSGRFEGLWVDEITQQFLHDLETLRLDVGPDPTVMSFWTRPVVPFALEGSGLGFPWYSRANGPFAAAETISGACLDDGDTPTGDVVLVTEENDPEAFGPIHQALLDCGIDFPDDFELVTTVVAPDPPNPENIELSVYVREAGR